MKCNADFFNQDSNTAVTVYRFKTQNPRCRFKRLHNYLTTNDNEDENCKTQNPRYRYKRSHNCLTTNNNEDENCKLQDPGIDSRGFIITLSPTIMKSKIVKYRIQGTYSRDYIITTNDNEDGDCKIQNPRYRFKRLYN
ncbi:hypothetical protein AVEN_117571-1 [Araneus ventricosus]|uniref:Uncharacterized protein n=1 Tax=Araneus ventricosus TaxID=182803 RepID=A0A4Y2IUC5_ARAVE|nr:hypothetical protein AVEN_117571-1 [Araneus ventricosus]